MSDILPMSPNVSASSAPKANEALVKAKFYAEIGKREKRPGFGRQSECDCSLLLSDFELKTFTYRLSIIYQCRKADVFCMVFNPGDGGFFGAQFVCHLFLSKARFKTSLLQENTNFELLISFVKIFGSVEKERPMA